MKVNWTEEKDKIIKEHYPTLTSKDVAEMIGCNVGAVYNRAFHLGVKKEEGFSAKITKQRWEEGRHENSRESAFKKGNIPFNKGRKALEYMSEESFEKIKQTTFKKGHTPHNHKPLGSLRKTKDGYLEIKVKEPNKWDLLHRVVWRDENGELGKGEIVEFIDGDRTNVKLENLRSIKRTEQIKKNTIQRYPKEVISLIRVSSKLQKMINEI